MKINKLLIVSMMVSGLFQVTAGASEERYQASYSSGDYWGAIKDASYARALEMIYKDIRDSVIATANDPEKMKELFAKLIAKNADKIAKILNGEGTEEEKKVEVLRLIEASLKAFESAPQGGLELDFRYSFDYATMELTWQRLLETVSCREWMVTRICETDPVFNTNECWYEGYYKNVDYKIEPKYSFYRVVNGNSTLITSLKQENLGGTTKFSTQLSAWPKIIRNALKSDDDGNSGRGLIYDFDTDNRPMNSTLTYKINASYNFCNKSKSWITEVVVDGDGDGFADFIPNPQAEIFRRDYGWLPVIINTFLM